MTTTKNTGSFTDLEREAMKARAKEAQAEARANRKKADGEKEVLEAINAMQEPDRAMAQRIHEIVTATAPDLWPKTWYGMPAYSVAGGKVVCFFQGAKKFEARYATLGFNDSANLDDDNMWPTAFALKKLTNTEEKRIVELVQKAVS